MKSMPLTKYPYVHYMYVFMYIQILAQTSNKAKLGNFQQTGGGKRILGLFSLPHQQICLEL